MAVFDQAHQVLRLLELTHDRRSARSKLQRSNVAENVAESDCRCTHDHVSADVAAGAIPEQPSNAPLLVFQPLLLTLLCLLLRLTGERHEDEHEDDHQHCHQTTARSR